MINLWSGIFKVYYHSPFHFHFFYTLHFIVVSKTRLLIQMFICVRCWNWNSYFQLWVSFAQNYISRSLTSAYFFSTWENLSVRANCKSLLLERSFKRRQLRPENRKVGGMNGRVKQVCTVMLLEKDDAGE